MTMATRAGRSLAAGVAFFLAGCGAWIPSGRERAHAEERRKWRTETEGKARGDIAATTRDAETARDLFCGTTHERGPKLEACAVALTGDADALAAVFRRMRYGERDTFYVGRVRRSLSILESLHPTDTEHLAVISRAQVLIADAEAIGRLEHLGGGATTCDDVKRLDSQAKTAPRFTAELLTEEADRRRAQEVKALADDLKRVASRRADEDTTTAEIGEWTAEARKLLDQAGCYDERAGRRLEESIKGWLHAHESRVAEARAEDERCRANPACVGERIASDLCAAIVEKRENEAEIKAINRRARKHGVVNLSNLNSLSEHVAFLDERIDGMKGRYEAAVGEAFREKTCREYVRAEAER